MRGYSKHAKETRLSGRIQTVRKLVSQLTSYVEIKLLSELPKDYILNGLWVYNHNRNAPTTVGSCRERVVKSLIMMRREGIWIILHRLETK